MKRMPDSRDRGPPYSMAWAKGPLAQLASAYLVVSVYLYAYILDFGIKGSFTLYAWTIGFVLVVFPLTAAGYVTYRILRAVNGGSTPPYSLSFALLGIVVAALPSLGLLAGPRALDMFLWLVLLIGPLGPLLPLILATIAPLRGEPNRPRVLPLVLLVAWVPSVVMWATAATSSSPFRDAELKERIAELIGGTAAHDFGPWFVVYLAAGAALLAAYIGSKGWIGRSESSAPRAGPGPEAHGDRE
jgi:hypothetical protein